MTAKKAQPMERQAKARKGEEAKLKLRKEGGKEGQRKKLKGRTKTCGVPIAPSGSTGKSSSTTTCKARSISKTSRR